MKRIMALFMGLLMLPTVATTTPNSSATIQKMSQMPLAFTKNMGQWDEKVLFRANSGGATMWFTKEGVTYQFTRRIDKGGRDDRRGTLHVPAGTRSVPLQEGLDSRLRGNDIEKDSVDQLVLTAKFIGANPNPEIITEGQLEYKCNYFLGNDPTKWHTDVLNYEAITLKDIYPGINLKYSGDGTGQAAYEFVAAPGADIAQIKVEYEGAESTSLDSDGKLILKTKWGDMTAAIKTPSNGVLSGAANFSQLSEKTIGFEANGPSQQALGTSSVGLVYSTYLGGGSKDHGYGIAVDGNGNAYVTGYTLSFNFPTQNACQTDQGAEDAFVTKLSSSGNSLIYSTYLGGGSEEHGNAIAVDGNGNAYVAGTTNSDNFPTVYAYQSTLQGSPDVFVSKLSSSGNSLIYSTYLGGVGWEGGEGIAIDASGNAYVTGGTDSGNFPILNPYQSTFQGYSDVFVTKLSKSGNGLIYSTYLGGEDRDYALDIAIDGNGDAYVTGVTSSITFPTQNPYQATFNGGESDAFVTKLSSSGNSLIYSTYLGGGDWDYGYSIAVDDSVNAYVAGATNSSNLPTLNPYQTYQGLAGLGDAFVMKLSGTGSSLIYSTYLGGESSDFGFGIAVNGSGNAYVTGYTNSSDFPTLNAYQVDQGTQDVFVTKLSSSGSSLIYSTYLGGGNDDVASSVAVDDSGNAYVTGNTASSNFPTLNPYQMDRGDIDAFVTALSAPPNYLCGDADGDGSITIADVVFLIDYIFMGGAVPQPIYLADVDCSGTINIADCVYLINYIFSYGSAPCGEF